MKRHDPAKAVVSRMALMRKPLFALPKAFSALSFMLLAAMEVCSALLPLPQGNTGIAARHPGDSGIAADNAVIFADDFESYADSSGLSARWNGGVYHYVSLATAGANVFAGARSLRFRNPRQTAELSNTVDRLVSPQLDALFLRYYSKFDASFDVTGSSHNGCMISASYFVNGSATPGVKADGYNKFLANYECWRNAAADPSPGYLNVYIYHPEQRDIWGDHFFPTGLVMPNTSLPGNFGPDFVPRPDTVPKLGQWYCYEFMVKANTPGGRDGRIACWLDGKIIADFPNLRLRDIDTLKIDRFGISLHIGSNTVCETYKYYDNVVAATSYIGPMLSTNSAQRRPNGGIESHHANPLVSGTRISFALEKASPVSVDIFTAQGKFAARPVHGTFSAGRHSIRWNGRNEAGGPVAGGVYVTRIRTADNAMTGWMAAAPAMSR